MLLKVIKLKNALMMNMFCFVVGCFITLNFVDVNPYQTTKSVSNSLALSEKTLIKYVAVILTAPKNIDKRNAIRNTWLRLANLSSSDADNSDFKYFFVIGIANMDEKTLKELKREQVLNNDLLLIPKLEDHYAALARKLLLTIQWVDSTFKNLLYMIKCDDDSFVRIDIILQELKKRDNDKIKSKLYWGYFKGNSHVKNNGPWEETSWFLCDRYLPYAMGGGYVLSAKIVQFISKNAEDLQLYKSEDATVGVWTAALSDVQRLHDRRFDTEWTSRGCNNSFIIRHKQTPDDMRTMFANLIKSKYTKLCTAENIVRHSYEYNWKVLPSKCCVRKL